MGILLGLGIALCIFVGMAFFIIAFIGGKVFSSEKSPLQIGEAAPGFSLPSLSGQVISLEDLRGKSVLLNFWTSSCQPCIAEMPLLEATSQKHEDLIVIGVNIGDSPAKVENFVAAEHLNFMILLDKDDGVSKDYLLTGFPTSVFINKDGIIQSYIVGELSIKVLEENLALIGID
ncbi:MAG TPA: TlpA family protein disulfide reductase [Anaerolineales bacterium]|nr:TlpA family protein disulfide reductase [Anaerolineales bacterium]